MPVQQENDDKFSSHHIFLPVRTDFTAGKPVSEVLPLNVRLASPDQLRTYHDLLMPLNPAAVISGPKFAEISRALPVNSAAEAFDYLLREQGPQINLKGASPALLNEEGLPTPFFSLFRVLAPLSGRVCEQQKQYVMIENDDSISVILFNTDKYQPLKVYLQFNHNNRPDYMIRSSVRAEHSLSYIKAASGGSSLKNHIFDLVRGTTELFSTSETAGPHIPVNVEPGELLILTF